MGRDWPVMSASWPGTGMEDIEVPCRTTTMDFRQLQMNIEIAGCGYRPCRCMNWHKNRTQKPLLLPFAASFFCNFRQIREIWRKRLGVENIIDMNLKDLEGILGNTKSLKRNNKKYREILIVPSMFPRFLFPCPRFSYWEFRPHAKSCGRL